MTKLKMHPDLGGNHASAVLINQAYAILSDPQRRRQYDETLNSRKSKRHCYPDTETPANTESSSYRPNPYQTAKKEHKPVLKRCLFCNTEHAQQVNIYCIRCASPISHVQPLSNNRLGELFGRRAAPRIAKVATLTIYPSWPHVGYRARLRDLSTSGFSMLTEYGARTGQILKFESSYLKGVAKVVSVRPNGANFSVHATLLTSEFITKAGVFITEKA